MAIILVKIKNISIVTLCNTVLYRLQNSVIEAVAIIEKIVGNILELGGIKGWLLRYQNLPTTTTLDNPTPRDLQKLTQLLLIIQLISRISCKWQL